VQANHFILEEKQTSIGSAADADAVVDAGVGVGVENAVTFDALPLPRRR
jgi:hypothetical protein